MTWFIGASEKRTQPAGPSLDEFVREALVDIVFGVQQAKLEVKDLAAIAPGRVNDKDVEDTTFVEFDIAVTTSEARSAGRTESSSVTSRISVVAASVGAGISDARSRTRDLKNENVSRIQFKVPIRLSVHFRNDPSMAGEIKILDDLLRKRTAKRERLGS